MVAAEARGFILGGAIARELGAGFVPPASRASCRRDTVSAEYVLEYGVDALEVHADALARRGARARPRRPAGHRRHGRARCASSCERLGGEVVGCAFLIELAFLGGRARLAPPRGARARPLRRGVSGRCRAASRRARRSPPPPDERVAGGRRPLPPAALVAARRRAWRASTRGGWTEVIATAEGHGGARRLPRRCAPRRPRERAWARSSRGRPSSASSPRPITEARARSRGGGGTRVTLAAAPAPARARRALGGFMVRRADRAAARRGAGRAGAAACVDDDAGGAGATPARRAELPEHARAVPGARDRAAAAGRRAPVALERGAPARARAARRGARARLAAVGRGRARARRPRGARRCTPPARATPTSCACAPATLEPRPTPSCCPARARRGGRGAGGLRRGSAWRSCPSAAARAWWAASSRCAAATRPSIALDLAPPGRRCSTLDERSRTAVLGRGARAARRRGAARPARAARSATSRRATSTRRSAAAWRRARPARPRPATGASTSWCSALRLRGAGRRARRRAASRPRAAGPDLRELLVGSEGALGVITEVALRVRRAPAERRYEGWLFRDFARGRRGAARARSRRTPRPTSRASPTRRRRGCRWRSPASGPRARCSAAYWALRGRRRRCLAIVGWEGDARRPSGAGAGARAALLRRHGGACARARRRARRGRARASRRPTCATRCSTAA